jgi:hypothetical protein
MPGSARPIRALIALPLAAFALIAPTAAMAAQPSGAQSETVTEPQPSAPAVCGEFTHVRSPAPGDSSVLNAVSADSASTAWAVGDWYDAGADVYHTMVLRRNGGRWGVVASEDPGNSRSALQGLTSIPGGDAWAVGFSQDAGLGFETLIERPAGDHWEAVASPSPGDQESVLWSVASPANGDAWAVGYQQDAGGPRRTLIEHWNGTRWKVVPSPSLGTDDNLLYGVAAVAPNDVWAVGVYSVPWFKTLVLHWNGSKWKVVNSPNVGDGNNFLYSVASLGDGHLIAVGSSLTDAGTATLAMRWDGSTWTVLTTPSPDQGFDELLSVAAAGPDEVWAVGHRQGTVRPFRTLAEHWNGTRWKVANSENRSTQANQFFGVAVAPGTANAWAVGSANGSSGQDRALIELDCAPG